MRFHLTPALVAALSLMAAAASTSLEARAQTVRIMALGDSITGSPVNLAHAFVRVVALI